MNINFSGMAMMPTAMGMDPSSTYIGINPFSCMAMSNDPSLFGMMGMNNYGQHGMMGNQLNMMMSQMKSIVQLSHCVLYPPNPNAPPPTIRKKPPGCKTVLVNGIPEKATEDIIREIFERCGEILTIRMSKNFCQVRFTNEAYIENAIYLSGYMLKVENRDEAPYIGRLHVDYAHARDDQCEYECQQRALQKETSHGEHLEQEYFRPPSPPAIVQYSDQDAAILSEKLRCEETFEQAVSILISWLERGECTKRTSGFFYSLIQSMNSHVHNLMNKKTKCEEDLNKAKLKLKQQMQENLFQFTEISKVFAASSLQKVWDHFTKPQRRDMELWKKQMEEIKKAHIEELLKDRIEDEMDTSSEDEGKDNSSKKGTERETLSDEFSRKVSVPDEADRLSEKYESVLCQSEQLEQNRETSEYQMSTFHYAAQGMQKEPLMLSQKRKKDEVEQKKSHAQKRKKSSHDKGDGNDFSHEKESHDNVKKLVENEISEDARGQTVVQFQYETVGSELNLAMSQMRDVIRLSHCVLYPPNLNAPPPTRRRRPLGCKTVFVGGLPENSTEDTIREIFERCGEILSIRMSKKNFCHIRFSNEAYIENAIYLSGYRLKIENKEESPYIGRLHVDYAQARDDQYEYECQQRTSQKDAQITEHQEQGYFRPPTPPLVAHYSDKDAAILGEKLRCEETFVQAILILISWLERGECNKKNSGFFYSMIQSTNSHVHRLMNKNSKYEDELNKAKLTLKQQMEGMLLHFNEIIKVFAVSSLQKVWHLFTKPQQKNIELWKKQTEEIKNAHIEELISVQSADEAGTAEDENEGSVAKKGTQQENKSYEFGSNANTIEADRLHEEKSSHCQPEETVCGQTESEQNREAEECQMHLLHPCSQSMQKELLTQKQIKDGTKQNKSSRHDEEYRSDLTHKKEERHETVQKKTVENESSADVCKENADQYHCGIAESGPSMTLSQTKDVIHLKHCVLYPPNPNAPSLTKRIKPPGCKTVFVGGLPENATEHVIKEIFERCGKILTIRVSKKNFCHIRFASEAYVESAIQLSGYKVKIENKDEALYAGRLHVDYAQARNDQCEYESQQRAARKEVRHNDPVERGHSPPPTPPPVANYSDHEAAMLGEKLRSKETFGEAVLILITWLERGECNKKNSGFFYSMIQSTNSHVRRLMNENSKYEEQLNKAKLMLKQQMEEMLNQFNEISKVFAASSVQKVRDHFTKAQRKNIELWKKQTEDIKNAHAKEVFEGAVKDEVNVSEEDDEGNASKKGTAQQEPGEDGGEADAEVDKLRKENHTLHSQLEAYQNEIVLLKTENKQERETRECQMQSLRQALQGMQKELLVLTQKQKKDEAELKELRSLKQEKIHSLGKDDATEVNLEREEKLGVAKKKPTENEMSEESSREAAVSRSSVVSSSSSSFNVTENEARLIGLISTFLNVHPFGASIEYTCSYLHQIDCTIRSRDVETLLRQFPSVFKEESTGIGASLEKKWTFCGFKKSVASSI